MQTVKIISDSTCDLSESQKEKYNIDVIPLHVILGDQVYEDGVNITLKMISDWADANKATPKTAAPSPEEIIEHFRPALEEYQEIVCFSISASMSASNSAMHLAAQELNAEDRIHVIDSMSLSSGIGLMALEAAQMAMDGADGKTIAEHVEKQKPLVRATFVVDTLMYLYRGGRCSGLTAIAGETLKLHPKISVIDGEMGAGKKYRGSMDRVIMNYARELEEDMKHAQPGRAFVVHSPCSPDIVKEVCDYVEGLHYFDEVCENTTGSVVMSHCGPGTLGVMYIAGE